MPRIPVAPEVRLVSRLKATPDGCLEWQGACNYKGYGQISVGTGAQKRRVGTHRLAYEIAHGPIPEGMVVRHRCDNRPCCNPFHLEVGTHADNTRDMVERGRAVRGDDCSFTKVREAQIADIRRRYIRRFEKVGPTGVWRSNARELAAEYGVSEDHLKVLATRGRDWRR